MSKPPEPFAKRDAIRQPPKKRDAIEVEDEPPSNQARGIKESRQLGRLWLFGMVFFFLVAVFVASILIQNLLPSHRAFAADAQLTPTLTWTLPPTVTNTPTMTPLPTRTINAAESGEMNTPYLSVVNQQAPSLTPEPRSDDTLEKIDEGWFSYTDNISSDSPNTIHLRNKNGYTAGTEVLACATQKVSQNDSRIETYAIGNPLNGQLRCWPAVLSDKFPSPQIHPDSVLRGAVSFSLWDWACGMSGAQCDVHPLSEWIIYKAIEQ